MTRKTNPSACATAEAANAAVFQSMVETSKTLVNGLLDVIAMVEDEADDAALLPPRLRLLQLRQAGRELLRRGAACGVTQALQIVALMSGMLRNSYCP